MFVCFFGKGDEKLVNVGMIGTDLSFLHDFALFVSDIDGQMVLVLVDSKIQHGGSPYRLLIEGLKIRNTRHIAIDGKASRGCYKIKGQGLLHVVSAWDTDNSIALGQLKTKNDEGKDVGEYNTIPALIETLDIKDAVVTIDAGGCYENIVDAVVEGEGNYLITVKGNQPTLLKEAETAFAEVESNGFEGVDCYQESDNGHGRIEER
ncbi:MAG: ISAs1 family transposase, partial [Planctomycetaceae bacterium]|nr:ISAs1 family transposase [Planctomycetaceae bacterium]